MAVYAMCEVCKTRRDATGVSDKECSDKTGHKRKVGWVANWKPSRTADRLYKTFGSALDKPKELADAQERQWKTDVDRGVLFPKSTTESRTFRSIGEEWWRNVAIGQKKIANPMRAEWYRVEMFLEWFGEHVTHDIAGKNGRIKTVLLEFADVEEWMTERVADGLAIGTINRDLKPLRWIMNYAMKKEYIDFNPVEDVVDLKGANIRVRWMTEVEVDLLIKAAQRLKDPSMIDVIDVGINTGFRKGNLERLAARDVGERIAAVKTKSGKAYDVPKSPDVIPTLDRLMAAHPTGPLLNTTNFDRRFRAVAKEAGLYPDPENGVEVAKEDKVTIHTLRHTFAALYLKRKGPNGEVGDLYKLSKLMGHSSIKVTEQTYAHICPKELDAQAPLMSTKIDRSVDFKIA